MINEPSVNVEETAVIVSVWRLDIIYYVYAFYDWLCDIKHIDVSDTVAATISLDGISSELKQILVLSCKGIAVVLASQKLSGLVRYGGYE